MFSVSVLVLLCPFITFIVGDEIVYIILSQPYTYNNAKALALKENIQASHSSAVVYLSHQFQHPGHWTVLPLIIRLLEKHHSETEWFLFCTEDTTINVEILQKILAQFKSEEEFFIGRALEDTEPTIIHHFSSNADFKYPLFPSGFVVSSRLLHRLGEMLSRSHNKSDFSIDASYELSQFIWDKGKGIRLTNASEFCIRPTPQCATSVSTVQVCNNQIISDKIYFAVKTCQHFHQDRVQIIKNTWANTAQHIGFFSDEADKSIPTIVQDVPNSPSGHCKKTAFILKYFKNLLKKQNFDWLVLTDDDTLLSVKRIESLLSCYDPKSLLVIGERYGYNIQFNTGYNYATGGAGVVLSAAAVKALVSSRACVCSSLTIPDDMFLFGVCLERLNITLIHSPLFHQARPNDYNPEYLSINSPITFHKHWMVDPIRVYNKYLTEERTSQHIEL